MIYFLRCSLVTDDIRLHKYIEACKDRKIIFHAITWDRLGRNSIQSCESAFRINAPYGRGWRNFVSKMLWQFFLLYQLIVNCNKYKIIHACDFDTMLPALIMKFFFKKKVIYDIYDAFSKKEPKNILHKLIKILDVFFLNNANLIILADEERQEQMGITRDFYKNKILVVENVPIISSILMSSPVLDDRIYLGYVGVFDFNRGIEDLLSCVQNIPHLYLNIAGTGALQELIVKMSDSCDRIHYWGQVDYKKGLEIMGSSHIVVGMYYPCIENHIYAAPNKYFEALYLAKPLLTSKGTLVGNKVLKYNSGYVIQEGKESLMNFLSHLSIDDGYQIKKCNAEKLWKIQYENYYSSKHLGEYISYLMLN